jgi:hypothetical protein
MKKKEGGTGNRNVSAEKSERIRGLIE